MHTTAELTAPAARIIIFFAFLRVPLTTSLRFEFALPVLFAFIIHQATMSKLFATFLRRFLLAFHK
jgi:hypothetical protein